jgi:hypothetical protein
MGSSVAMAWPRTVTVNLVPVALQVLAEMCLEFTNAYLSHAPPLVGINVTTLIMWTHVSQVERPTHRSAAIAANASNRPSNSCCGTRRVVLTSAHSPARITDSGRD